MTLVEMMETNIAQASNKPAPRLNNLGREFTLFQLHIEEREATRERLLDMLQPYVRDNPVKNKVTCHDTGLRGELYTTLASIEFCYKLEHRGGDGQKFFSENYALRSNWSE